MLSTALVSVSNILIANSVEAGLVGLMMTYTISVTTYLVRGDSSDLDAMADHISPARIGSSEVPRMSKKSLVSVERVLGYASLLSEAALEVPERFTSKAWREHGGIEFQCVPYLSTMQ